MSNNVSLKLPFQNDSKQFELLCRDILERYYAKNYKDLSFPNAAPFFYLYGRNGENQHGIDIMSRKRINNKGFCVAQCKNYYNATANVVITKIKEDICQIKELDFPVSRFIIMTSHPQDTHIQDAIADLADGEIDVRIMFWEDLSEKILNDSWLHATWYPDQFSDIDRESLALDKPLLFHCPLCTSNMVLKQMGEEYWYECENCHRKTKINVFVSQSSPINRKQELFIKRIETYLRKHGMDPVTLGRSIYDMEYPLRGIKRWMEQCYGLITIALRRTEIVSGNEYGKLVKNQYNEIMSENKVDKSVNGIWVSSPFCHIESAMAFQLELPILIYREEGVKNDGMLEASNMGLYMPTFTLENDSLDYIFEEKEFLQLMTRWMERVCDNWNRRFSNPEL